MRKSVKSMLSPLGKTVALACSLAMCVFGLMYNWTVFASAVSAERFLFIFRLF